MFQSELQIFPVFRSESGNAQLDSRQVNTFVFAKSSAVYDFAGYFLAAHLQHPQFDQSVGKKYAVAAMDFARQRLENGADTSGIAENAGSGNHEFLSGAQNHRHAAGEGSSSNLGPLQVSEDGEWLVQIQGPCAPGGGACGVIPVRGTREIQTGDVHARPQEPAEQSRRQARGADGANKPRVSKRHMPL